MVERAADARRIELANLPQAERAALGAAAAGLADCAQRLRRRDLATSQAWTELHEAARPPDAYDDGLRIAGLYPLATLPASIGIRRYERATRDAFAVALAELPVHGVLRSYAPARASTLDALEPAAILARARSRADALGIPRFTPDDEARLFAAYAPTFVVDERSDDDRIGTPALGAMRQWGHHATAFVGRRHFDEPFLIERYFVVRER
jgi:hypothetical protein